MDKKKMRKRKKRIISVAVVTTAFLVCILATFGVTMAYFGGVSGANSATMTLKTAVWVNASATTSATSGYVSPSQAIERKCVVKVKSSNTSSGTAITDANKGSNSLLRAVITWNVGSGITIDGSSVTSYDVTLGTSTTVVAKLMKWSSGTDADNNWYLVDKSTTTVSSSSTMYTINSASGEQTLNFTMKLVIPDTITNATVSGSETSKTITVSVTYNVIQADFYGGTATALAKTVGNAKAIFNATTGSAAY